MRTWIIPLGLLLVLLAVRPIAAAEPPNAHTRAKAQAHFKAGEAFFEANAYDDAVREYLAAYELVHLPDLLFNVAQAHRAAGDRKHALEYYRKYLDKAPHGRGSSKAQEYIAELEAAELAANPPPPPVKQPIVPPLPIPPPVAPDIMAKLSAPEPAIIPPPTTKPVKPVLYKLRKLSWIGIVLLGAGAAAGGAAIGTWEGGAVRNIRAGQDALERLAPTQYGQAHQGFLRSPTGCVLPDASAAPTADASAYTNACTRAVRSGNIANGLWAATGVLAAAGAVTIIIGEVRHRRHTEARPQAALTGLGVGFQPGGARLEATLSF